MGKWKLYIKNFEAYLKIEKSLSQNSVDAYLHDVELLEQYTELNDNNASPGDLELKNFENFFRI